MFGCATKDDMITLRRCLTVAVVAVLSAGLGCRSVQPRPHLAAEIVRLEAQVALLSNTVERISASIETLEHHLVGIEQFNRMVDAMRYEPVIEEQLIADPDEKSSGEPNQASDAIGTETTP
jgi:hypothetical protein